MTRTNLDGSNDSGTYIDRRFVWTLSASLQLTNIRSAWELPNFIGRGADALVDGADDAYNSIIKELSNDVEKLERFTFNNNERKYANIHEENNYDAAAGYMLLRYMAKQTSEETTKAHSEKLKNVIDEPSLKISENENYWFAKDDNNFIAGNEIDSIMEYAVADTSIFNLNNNDLNNSTQIFAEIMQDNSYLPKKPNENIE